MRVFPTPVRGLVLAGCLPVVALSLFVSSSAHAVDSGNDSAASIQIKLVEARQRVNALYDRAAVASEQLNGAIYRAQLAKDQVARNAVALATARKGLAVEQQSVAQLTVQDLDTNTGIERFNALVGSEGPGQLLDRAGAYSSAQEAMTAHIDSLSASTVVYDAAKRRAQQAEAKQRKALAEQKAAKVTIEKDLADAKVLVMQTAAERTTLLAKLAKAQQVSLAKVTKRQNEIDKELDSQPGTPAGGDPTPADPPKTDTPKPTTPAPTTPKPSDPPKPPKTDPAPVPSNKVETAIAFAQAQLGEPYKWGAAGPNSWDCSGLTMKSYAAAGINVPHYGVAQYQAIRPVSIGNIQRGDLLFWSNGSVGSIYHVAMYLGNGQMIQAPRTGRNVEIVSLSYWIRPDKAGRPG